MRRRNMKKQNLHQGVRNNYKDTRQTNQEKKRARQGKATPKSKARPKARAKAKAKEKMAQACSII